MTQLSARKYVPQHDQEALEHLLLMYRLADQVERYPTLQRLRLLLASRLYEPAYNACIWENNEGEIVGFAFLSSRQSQAQTYGYETFWHPQIDPDTSCQETLHWLQKRVQQIVHQQKQCITLYRHLDRQDNETASRLQAEGFVAHATLSNCYMACPLSDDLTQPALLAGFSLRPLRDKRDFARYQQVYANDFTPVGTEHLHAQFLDPEYSHLVIESANAEFAALCESSINSQEWREDTPRIGWIDYIGVAERYRRHGLGRAILQAMHQQLRSWGAEMAMLITSGDNAQAQRLYTATGYQIVATESIYTRQFAPQA